MTERLKQIWAGFEKTTTRQLTNSQVDHIVVEHRRDWRAEDAAFLPRGYEGPATTAFAALKARLASKGKDRKNLKGESDTILSDVPYAAPETDAARDLVRALKSTDMRIRRPMTSYADAVAKPKKGLFGGSKPAKPQVEKPKADAGEKPKKRFGLF